MAERVTIVGAGLAGCEAAWQLIKRGVPVRLIEMKPVKYSPAHKSPGFAELVCSNSLKAEHLTNASGLLKAELRALDSLILKCAEASRVPAGGALAVDRDVFSEKITDTIKNLYDLLDQYELDLAIVEGKPPEGEMNGLLLDTDYLVCVVCNESPLAKKSMVTLSDIRKEKMILRLPGSGTQNLFVSHLESIGMSIDEFNVALEVDNIATIKDLIRKNMGISILAHSACMDELRKGKITALPIENLSMVRQINILYHKDFPHTETLQAITKLYRETAKQYT